MSSSDRLYLYMHWFDRLPAQTQFEAAFWSACGILLINIMLALYLGLPLGLTCTLAVIIFLGPRVMYKFGFITLDKSLPAPPTTETRICMEAPAWMFRLNHWFDAQPEYMRIIAVAAGTMVVLVINLLLHALISFPVGLLVLLAVLVLGWARVCYVYDWIIPAGSTPPVTVAPESAG